VEVVRHCQFVAISLEEHLHHLHHPQHQDDILHDHTDVSPIVSNIWLKNTKNYFLFFLAAIAALYVAMSVGWSVGWSVGRLVGWSVGVNEFQGI
jgi:hypothetical protein